MLYQLPNGKVIQITIEEYLSLSDQELNDITRTGYYGEDAPASMFYDKQTKEPSYDPEEEQIDPLDFIPDSDETDTFGPLDIHNLPEEE
jgi:hypothetical protein